VRRHLPKDRDLRELPQSKRRPPAKPLPEYARDHPGRNEAIVAAYRSGGYTLRDIGDFFGIHYSRVSKIVQAADVRRCKVDESPLAIAYLRVARPPAATQLLRHTNARVALICALESMERLGSSIILG
jgi:hypothetical protein